MSHIGIHSKQAASLGHAHKIDRVRRNRWISMTTQDPAGLIGPSIPVPQYPSPSPAGDPGRRPTCRRAELRDLPAVGVDGVPGDGRAVTGARGGVDGHWQPGDEQAALLRTQLTLHVHRRVRHPWRT